MNSYILKTYKLTELPTRAAQQTALANHRYDFVRGDLLCTCAEEKRLVRELFKKAKFYFRSPEKWGHGVGFSFSGVNLPRLMEYVQEELGGRDFDNFSKRNLFEFLEKNFFASGYIIDVPKNILYLDCQKFSFFLNGKLPLSFQHLETTAKHNIQIAHAELCRRMHSKMLKFFEKRTSDEFLFKNLQTAEFLENGEDFKFDNLKTYEE